MTALIIVGVSVVLVLCAFVLWPIMLRLSKKAAYRNIRLTLDEAASALGDIPRLQQIEQRAKEIQALCSPERERPLRPTFDDLCYIVKGDRDPFFLEGEPSSEREDSQT